MKRPPFSSTWLTVVAGCCLSALATADLYVSNFTALNGSVSATGVWRNQTSSTDTLIPVTLSQTGGAIRGTGVSNPSVIDNSAQWIDIPPFLVPPLGLDVFNPNFTGDSINVEVMGGATSVVTIHFHAQVVDPVISFTDVDTQTVMSVSSPFTVVGSSGNLGGTSTTVVPVGMAPFFEEECAGSLRVNGTHTQLVITLQNNGISPTQDDDRTSFVVSTQVAPAALPPAAALTIALVGSNLMLSWPSTNSFSQIRWSTNLIVWEPVPGLDPTTTTSWQAALSQLGPRRYFRGIVPPP